MSKALWAQQGYTLKWSVPGRGVQLFAETLQLFHDLVLRVVFKQRLDVWRGKKRKKEPR